MAHCREAKQVKCHLFHRNVDRDSLAVTNNLLTTKDLWINRRRVFCLFFTNTFCFFLSSFSLLLSTGSFRNSTGSGINSTRFDSAHCQQSHKSLQTKGGQITHCHHLPKTHAFSHPFHFFCFNDCTTITFLEVNFNYIFRFWPCYGANAIKIKIKR